MGCRRRGLKRLKFKSTDFDQAKCKRIIGASLLKMSEIVYTL